MPKCWVVIIRPVCCSERGRGLRSRPIALAKHLIFSSIGWIDEPTTATYVIGAIAGFVGGWVGAGLRRRRKEKSTAEGWSAHTGNVRGHGHIYRSRRTPMSTVSIARETMGLRVPDSLWPIEKECVGVHQ